MEHSRNYHDRRPVAHHNPPRQHYTKKHGSWKPKQQFPTERKALHWIARHWWIRRQGYTAYQCPICGQWHVGKMKETE